MQEDHSSVSPKAFPGFSYCIREAYKKKGLSENTIAIMSSALAKSSKKQYNTALKYWWDFCIQFSHNPYCSEESTVLQCLSNRFNEGGSYQTLNNLRSAIHHINSGAEDSKNFKRFFTAVFKLRPTAPKYNSTWDVGIVLEMLRAWGPTELLDLRKLTLKLTMLLALGSAFRVQTLHLIHLKSILVKQNSGVEIKIKGLIKTSKPGAIQPSAFFPFFKDPDMCIARTIMTYLKATKDIRQDEKQLLISFSSPHKAVGQQTISRWLKLVMKEADVDEQFTAHSTRHASTSKAHLEGVSVNMIKSAASWSENSKVFAKFYNKPILGKSFAEAVFCN